MTEKPASIPLDFWQSRYQQNDTPWNLGQSAPAFTALLENKDPKELYDNLEMRPRQTVAVLGSGHGHDAALFAQKGLDVTGFDITPEAIHTANKTYGNLPGLQFVEADIFQLPSQYPNRFDWVVEHTCFCAIHPKQRETYVQVASTLLKPGGKLLGIYFAHNNWGGPPYATNEEEIRNLFTPAFDIQYLVKTPHSIPQRLGEEYLGLFQKL